MKSKTALKHQRLKLFSFRLSTKERKKESREVLTNCLRERSLLVMNFLVRMVTALSAMVGFDRLSLGMEDT